MKVAVIGAGVTGLVAAHRLTEAGHSADVYERWPGLGGQVASLDIGGGQLLERYYHHLFTSDREIAALYRELGMEDAIEWLPSSVAVFAHGHNYPFTTPLDLLRFRPLSIRARLRTGLAVLRLARRHREVGSVERITAREWIEANMGQEVWLELWGPLLRGKFGDRAEDISMAWLWSKLTLRRRIEGGEARREMLGYPHGGWQPLLERLRESIERNGRVLIDRPAALVAAGRAGGGFDVSWGQADSFRSGHDPSRFERAGSEPYEAVIATTANSVFEALLDEGLKSGLAAGYLERLGSIDYHSALCMLLEIDRDFGGHYWTNVADRELPFIGLIEQTKLLDPARYGGRRFLYVANYLEPGDSMLELEPRKLLALYEPGLRRVNPAFSRDWIRRMWVFHEPDAQPIVDLGYAERMPSLQTGVPGLVLANTTQIYPEDRGTNYSVRLGTEAAAAVRDSLQ